MDNVTAVLAELHEEHRRLSAELSRVERVIDVIVELSGGEPQVRATAPAPVRFAPDAPASDEGDRRRLADDAQIRQGHCAGQRFRRPHGA